MIKIEKFALSRRPYAIAPERIRLHPPRHTDGAWKVIAPAVWFRGPRDTLRACIGTIDGYVSRKPHDWRDAMELLVDGRYGGDAHGRWNGFGYWGSENPVTMDRHLQVLRPMLDNYPEIPTGYDGWWVYP